MSESGARGITVFLFGFLAICLVAVDAQFSRLLPAALSLLIGGTP